MKEIVDLTHDVAEGMTTFGSDWHPRVRIEQMGTIPDVGRESRQVQLGTHTGTHVDAPLHFLEDGPSIDEVPLDVLVGDVTVVDLTHLGEGDAVTVKELKGVDPGRRTILRYGWGRHFEDADRYYDGYPYLTEDAARYLVSEGVELLGYDTCSPDDSRAPLDGGPGDSPIHKLLLGSGVVLVEYLANLEQVAPGGDWTICALPLRIRGGDGAPARVCVFR